MLLSALQSIEVPPAIPESSRSPDGVKAALLYRAGQWEQAHRVAQDLETPEGSFWHGILHRHEKDWSNAGYWFRRVGRHAIYGAIYDDTRAILTRHKGPQFRLGSEWDPLQFIEWCKDAAQDSGSPEQAILTEIQAAEWRRLFEWCVG